MSLEISEQFPDPKKGGIYVASGDTAEKTGNFRGILALADAVVDITGGTIAGVVGGTSLATVPIPKNTWLPFYGTRFKFASGAGIAYNR